ncbi:type I restriction-modification system restriction subunit domain protein, partial [Mycobacterium ulcerans str. Harvey]
QSVRVCRRGSSNTVGQDAHCDEAAAAGGDVHRFYRYATTQGDKATSIETFGSFIHTYKFDEAVADGVVLDLQYEARRIDQELTSPKQVDKWFELKTRA